jgi:hypothetical protein
MGDEDELFLRVKAQESAKERPESRHSQDMETQKEFLPPMQPHAMPNKARSPTSEEVSEIMRRMQTEMKEFADEALQKSKEKSANRLFCYKWRWIERQGSGWLGLQPQRLSEVLCPHSNV